MFCYQCQETLNNKGCTKAGVCGKKADVASAQDLLVYTTKLLCDVLNNLRGENYTIDKKYNHMVTYNMFITITNANFDLDMILDQVVKTIEAKDELLAKLNDKSKLRKLSLYSDKDRAKLMALAEIVGVLVTKDEDQRSLKELATYGIKGMSAYMKHANTLNYDDESIDIFIQETLARFIDVEIPIDELYETVLKTGEYGVKAMALLDKANTETYGNPEITKVNIGVSDKPGILISGHDLKDIEMLLEQTEGSGVDVYTHSEMLPAHYYPKFKKYKHFIGNYGNSWWMQKEEFEKFNGPVLFTTNCIVPPKTDYIDRIYTTGAAGFPGCKHIVADENGHKDFTEIIEHAKKCKAPVQIEEGELVGGFAHNQVLALKDKVVDAVKSGAIKRFVVMGGCDGRQKGRSYYTEFAEKLPKDTVILTAGCAKYRYNKLNLGDIAGIPRVLDAGQCNDSYSLAMIALALKDAFGLDDINDLPIVYNIAWYEQKAVIVLLALLSLGVKNIHLGPTLPAFLSDNVVNILVEKFGIAPNSSVDEDLAKFFA
ncbi:hydroxylamine reductase [Fenollaria massiliensis]|uniref:Hydroxylamine reductase n=1 Tax=Fenollaria massiliensis TaxID=938288 RepID=A0A9E7DJR8_9FIRM|nr:hydroxylamine reductase [Fenollaria massiliensis]UQK59225.1 hydroxylamine reductase [Fenollaria massiliensis]